MDRKSFLAGVAAVLGLSAIEVGAWNCPQIVVDGIIARKPSDKEKLGQHGTAAASWNAYTVSLVERVTKRNTSIDQFQAIVDNDMKGENFWVRVVSSDDKKERSFIVNERLWNQEHLGLTNNGYFRLPLNICFVGSPSEPIIRKRPVAPQNGVA